MGVEDAGEQALGVVVAALDELPARLLADADVLDGRPVRVERLGGLPDGGGAEAVEVLLELLHHPGELLGLAELRRALLVTRHARLLRRDVRDGDVLLLGQPVVGELGVDDVLVLVEVAERDPQRLLLELVADALHSREPLELRAGLAALVPQLEVLRRDRGHAIAERAPELHQLRLVADSHPALLHDDADERQALALGRRADIGDRVDVGRRARLDRLVDRGAIAGLAHAGGGNVVVGRRRGRRRRRRLAGEQARDRRVAGRALQQRDGGDAAGLRHAGGRGRGLR